MALKYFYDGMSQPSRSVLLLLRCANVEFESCRTHIARGEHQTEDFAKLNPTKTVPTLLDGDFPLFESTAILRYLCNSRNLADHWYPSDLKKRSKIDEYLSWHHTNLRLGAAFYFRHLTLIPLLTGKPPNVKEAEKYLKLLNTSMETFEGYFLKNTPFISSDKITIADLMAVEEFAQLEVMGSKAPPLTQCVKEWMERCIEKTEPHYSDVHAIVLKVKEKAANL